MKYLYDTQVRLITTTINNMSKKISKIDDPLESLKDDSEITSIDPTTIGGLDKNTAEDFDESALEWTKSRGKKKDASS